MYAYGAVIVMVAVFRDTGRMYVFCNWLPAHTKDDFRTLPDTVSHATSTGPHCMTMNGDRVTVALTRSVEDVDTPQSMAVICV
jgi:hypothetical protein